MKNVVVLIDVSNLYYCVKKRFSSTLNYLKLLEVVKEYGTIYRAIAYGAQMNGESDRFIAFLEHQGIEPKYKEPQVYYDDKGKENRKADWDVGIAMDAVRLLDLYDTLILVTADGDLIECVKWVQERGRRVIVIGSGINHDLRAAANEAIEITKEWNETNKV